LAYEIAYKRSVARDLKALTTQDRKKIIDRIEDSLGSNPLNQPLLKGSFAGLRRLRIGDYRVIYLVEDAAVLILRIGHRRDVYR